MLAHEKKPLIDTEKDATPKNKVSRSKSFDNNRPPGSTSPRHENAELRVVGDVDMIRMLEKQARQLGAHSIDVVMTSESLPADVVHAEFSENQQGEYLRAARYREGLTQMQVAQLTGIPQRHLSEMENRKRTIGKTVAKRLAFALNVDYRIFL